MVINKDLSTSDRPNAEHSVLKSILLHILPGILTTAVLILIKPAAVSMGFPALFAFLLAVLLIDIPFMIGVMLIEGKKITGRYSIKNVALFREKVNWKTFAWVFAAAFVLLYLIISLTAPLSSIFAETAFAWLPEWIFFDDPAQYQGYAKNILVLVFSLQLVITGVVLPWVEELYFRGYLLPRISRLKGWAPVVGGLLFGLYHGWQLYGWVGVSLLGIGLGVVVWWKKDLRLGISLHVFANALVRLMLLMSVISI